MFQIVGKAFYTVTFEGKEYHKIRYSLLLHDDDVKKRFSKFEGSFYDTVCVKDDAFNSLPQIGDLVRVSYNRYGKPDAIIVLSN